MSWFRLTAAQVSCSSGSRRRLRVVPVDSVPTAGPVWTKAAEPTVLLAVGVAAQAPVFAAYSVNVGVIPTAPALNDFPRRLHSQVADSEQQQGQQTGLHFASTLVSLCVHCAVHSSLPKTNDGGWKRLEIYTTTSPPPFTRLRPPPKARRPYESEDSVIKMGYIEERVSRRDHLELGHRNRRTYQRGVSWSLDSEL